MLVWFGAASRTSAQQFAQSYRSVMQRPLDGDPASEQLPTPHQLPSPKPATLKPFLAPPTNGNIQFENLPASTGLNDDQFSSSDSASEMLPNLNRDEQPGPWQEFTLPSKRLLPEDWYLSALARAYFFDDQRIEWSGLEATFGVEAAITGGVRRQHGDWEVGVAGEIYFNQKYDQNILVDSAERRSYLGTWEVDLVEISQLYFTARNGDFFVALGKMVTPFGRYYFPLYQNSRNDAPFIRTESILWRENGLLLQWDPGPLTFTAAIINGGNDRDANSSKGLVARVGYDRPWFAFGGSIKAQDGIGSEGQKIYNEHVGIDMMFRRGRWTISGEAIYDQYGFRRPGFDPNDITWKKSIYYRDLNYANGKPITGFGYYLNIGYESPRWTSMLNYGEFYPQAIGVPQHDITTRRGILKMIYHSSETLDTYAMFLKENDVNLAQENRLRKGWAVLIGFQIAL